MYKLSNKIIHYITLLTIQCFFLIYQPFIALADNPQNSVLAFRISDSEFSSRFVADLSTSKKPVYKIYLLSDPARLVIEINDTVWGNFEVNFNADKVIKEIRYFESSAENSTSTGANHLKIVMDLKVPVTIDKHFVLEKTEDKPTRIVIDLNTKNANTSSNYPDLKNVKIPVPKLKTRRKPVIIIDAGHGGHDPGTIGRRGTKEKDITLAYALELAKSLKATKQYETILTRSDNRFIKLDDRVDIARKNQGNLFISLHADAAENTEAKGSSVYTLSEKGSDKEAEALAAKENKADIISGIDLADKEDEISSILIDLVQRDTKNKSSKFAELTIDALQNATIVRKNGHRFAGFRVLMGPDIPSVLIELGFLSNRREEKLLNSETHKKKLVNSIVTAIDKYFEEHPVN